MKTIRVQASREYDVMIGSGLINLAGQYVRTIEGAKKAALISDDIVYGLYGHTCQEAFKEAGLEVFAYVFPHGEQSKNLSTYGQILEFMNEKKLTRSDLVVALGGGVTGDMAGFAAATYQRGIRFVQIPTTLLAAVDSSVGGKTAVDLKNSKNQVGCFWQPSLVLCDTDTLATLPEEQYRCGCAEVIKYGVIGSEEFFQSLLETPVKEQAEQVIATCVEMKRDIVQEDEYDTGKRMLLNFGHTFGHAAEACSDFSLLHGQAVAMGMAVMARAACREGKCEEAVVTAIETIEKKYGLPDRIPYSKDALLKEIAADKKMAGSSMRIVVPKRIGACVIETIPAEQIGQILTDGGVA